VNEAGGAVSRGISHAAEGTGRSSREVDEEGGIADRYVVSKLRDRDALPVRFDERGCCLSAGGECGRLRGNFGIIARSSRSAPLE
jgi:hypothetical protein